MKDRNCQILTVYTPTSQCLWRRYGHSNKILPGLWCDNHWETLLCCFACCRGLAYTVDRQRVLRELNVSITSVKVGHVSTPKENAFRPLGLTAKLTLSKFRWRPQGPGNCLGSGLYRPTSVILINTWRLDYNVFFLDYWLHWQLM